MMVRRNTRRKRRERRDRTTRRERRERREGRRGVEGGREEVGGAVLEEDDACNPIKASNN
eukprot:750683-Hanusia_phi.AAC.3